VKKQAYSTAAEEGHVESGLTLLQKKRLSRLCFKEIKYSTMLCWFCLVLTRCLRLLN